MAIITISRGCHSNGAEVARLVAERLGYDCVAREILLEASEHFNVPETRLQTAMEDAPSFLDRLTSGRQRYIAYIRAALLRVLRQDNVVYHGLAGHFFIQNVPQVMKVRVLADFNDRVKHCMEEEHLSKEEASRLLQHTDRERHRWSSSLYGIDTSDPSLYDLVLHVRQLSVQCVADLICHAAQSPCFRTTEEGLSALSDLALAAEVHAHLIDIKPDIEVTAGGGEVLIKLRENISHIDALIDSLRERAYQVEGVKVVHVQPDIVG